MTSTVVGRNELPRARRGRRARSWNETGWIRTGWIRAGWVLAGLVLVLGVSAAEAQPTPEDDLEVLVGWMTGSFSSAAQAAETEGYFDIRLETVRIWQGRDDGVWLYVQQGVADRFEEPYRQRVYRVDRDGDRFSSAVYSLPGDPLDLAGAWAEPERFDRLAPDELSERTGCTVFLERQGDRFVGSTVEDRCTSQLRGASYATSEVEVSAEGLTSWDRGFDASDQQVWGAEDGPYVFLRVEPSP